MATSGVGHDVSFSLDNFQQPKRLTLKETLAQQILNLLLMRPGNLPSLPHIGINVRQYLYGLDGDLDPDEIRQKIHTQCSQLASYVSIGEVGVVSAPYQGQSILVIIIPIIGLDETDSTLIYGFTKDGTEGISYALQYDDTSSTSST